jgi:ABC-2 type transport system permease protein
MAVKAAGYWLSVASFCLMPLTTAHAIRALARASCRSFVNAAQAQFASNRLMFSTICIFLCVYLSAAFVLVARGLGFVHQIALLGPLLTERLIFLLFFFFFGMLILSNATITGMGLFRRKDTSWLLSLPLQHHSLVLWKTVEGMALASWGLVLLSAPILGAVGRVLNAGPAYYFMSMPAILCLVVLAANLSSWLLLLVMRWLTPTGIKVLAGGVGLLILWTAIEVWPGNEGGRNPDVAANAAKILTQTELFTHPLLPSSWVAEVVMSSARAAYEPLLFYTGCLLSYTLAACLVTLRLAERLFYPAWQRSLQPAKSKNAVAADPGGDSWLRWLGLSRISQALVLKDLRSFIREPAQWGQTVLIFGLLFLYVINLRRIVFDYKDGFWAAVTSHLNLLVACLSLSTLTTRFIFPQLSQEGQRMWIVGLSPVPLARVMRTKLVLNSFVTGALTSGLVLLSCVMLESSLTRALLHLSMIVIMTLGLNSMALGLGGMFPNFREPNPSKIVSGFGGTLCLILSFIYILAANFVAMLPSMGPLTLKIPGWMGFVGSYPVLWSIGALLVLTLVFGMVPFIFALRMVKNLDYFGKV